MSMQYIRDTYKVPAKRGGRVEYHGDATKVVLGTITGSRNAHLRVRFDGAKAACILHPTWNLKFLPDPVKTLV